MKIGSIAVNKFSLNDLTTLSKMNIYSNTMHL